MDVWVGGKNKMWGGGWREEALSPVERCPDELLSYDSSQALSEVLPASVPAGVD